MAHVEKPSWGRLRYLTLPAENSQGIYHFARERKKEKFRELKVQERKKGRKEGLGLSQPFRCAVKYRETFRPYLESLDICIDRKSHEKARIF